MQQVARQNAELGRAPGNNAVFIAPSTVAGPGGERIEQPTDTPLHLSLDDAISYALERNVSIRYERANEKEVAGLTQGVFANLIPNFEFQGQTSTQEINLAAMGFKPQVFASLGSKLGMNLGGFATIVKVNTTQAVLSANQQLFNMPDFELYKGAKSEKAVVQYNTLMARGEVVLAVATSYLQVLADESNLANAQAQERAAHTFYQEAVDSRNAGTGTNLDALRGQVDYQQRQQATLAASAQIKKDIIQLNRIMGLPAAQPLELTDTAPFAELAELPLPLARETAYEHRKDLLSLQSAIDVENRELRAAKYQRLPTLAFTGYYGVLGETTGLYHGVFNAQASLKFPIFREAAQRGEEDQVSAQLQALRDRENSLRVDIDAQIRTAMLDVAAARELVKVAQNNVELAEQELSDERDRFTAGVDTNLPVIDAEASLTGAQAQLVRALYQYNTAKLMLARNTGVIESRYRTYLGK